jgi:trans-2-enoyl-CoA reductase
MLIVGNVTAYQLCRRICDAFGSGSGGCSAFGGRVSSMAMQGWCVQAE